MNPNKFQCSFFGDESPRLEGSLHPRVDISSDTPASPVLPAPDSLRRSLANSSKGFTRSISKASKDVENWMYVAVPLDSLAGQRDMERPLKG